MKSPRGAKLVGGVWLPETDLHFEDWMLRGKRARVVEGKHTYQYHKLELSLEHQPAARRGVCLDIGANIGLWAMWLARAFQSVQAFEPVPLFCDIFPFNVTAANVTLHRTALGKAPGKVSMTMPLEQTGNSHIAVAGVHPGLRHGDPSKIDTWHAVPMRTLDSFGFEAVDFIKIDVEGYELNVVEGGEQTIRRCRPNMIVEQKGCEHAYGHARDAAKRRLESWGMKPLAVLSGDWVMGW